MKVTELLTCSGAFINTTGEVFADIFIFFRNMTNISFKKVLYEVADMVCGELCSVLFFCAALVIATATLRKLKGEKLWLEHNL